uniref:NADH-ubiquinone oxidoreductase chain 4 n=1 Tax=Capsaloides cristatus TaxID=1101449 RepID=A0A6M3R5V5_9PLAT|nr:NADH dehydrogenase subunit 4 [Capsaloides cristatus]
MKSNTTQLLVLPASLCWLGLISVYGCVNIDYSDRYLSISSFSLFLSLIPLIFFCFFFNILLQTPVSSSMLYLSMVCSIICFNCNNSVLFWIFYELAIIPLLFLLFTDSPYSERFLAVWYLLGYIMVTSLPMLWVLVYMSYSSGSFTISEWENDFGILSLVLFVLFITKIPLPPFHSWLPVVHAEANSYVSIMLSGYIMKLGLIGAFRFNSHVWEDIFPYVGVSFLFSLIFFFNSFLELDSKRWLAFLSLSHILIAIVSLFCQPWMGVNISSFYCLGHGISAGLLFYLFLCFYNNSGSRNWLILGDINMNSLFIRFLSVTSLITLSSFPPSIQFLSEVGILLNSFVSSVFVLPYSVYLFIGGLVPALLISYFVSRCSNLTNISFYYFSLSVQVIFCFSCFFWGALL